MLSLALSLALALSFALGWLFVVLALPWAGSSIAISVLDRAIYLYSPMRITLCGGQPLFNHPKGAELEKQVHFDEETMKFIRVFYRSPTHQKYFSTASALLKITCIID